MNVYKSKFCDSNVPYSMWFQIMDAQTYYPYGSRDKFE
jgi:hypothetical protein